MKPIIASAFLIITAACDDVPRGQALDPVRDACVYEVLNSHGTGSLEDYNRDIEACIARRENAA